MDISILLPVPDLLSCLRCVRSGVFKQVHTVSAYRLTETPVDDQFRRTLPNILPATSISTSYTPVVGFNILTA